MKRVLYFHGFASSPHGRKVDQLRELLDAASFEIVAPDMNVPSFRHLDFDAMVGHAVSVARSNPPDVLVGSSLGSLIALSVAAKLAKIPLVLIAPAFAMGERWLDRLPDGDPISLFNYAVDVEAPIHRRFFEQMARVTVDCAPPPSRVTVLMGRLDESVPFETVEARWAEWEASGQLVAGSRLIEFPDGDHRLIEHAGRIAEAIREAAAERAP